MRDTKTHLDHYLITIAWYHGKLRMLRKVLTRGIHLVCDVGHERKGMQREEGEGSKGKEHPTVEKNR